MPPELLNSRAYLTMTGETPFLLLTQFYRMRRWRKVRDEKGIERTVYLNEDFDFTCVEAYEYLMISERQFIRVMADLEARGFIDKVQQGGSAKGVKNIYRISDRYLTWRR